MPLAKDRELIQISSPAYKHLKAVVAAMKKSGLPTSGTMVASQVILSIPLPEEPQPVKPLEKKRPRRKAVTPMSQTVPVVGA